MAGIYEALVRAKGHQTVVSPAPFAGVERKLVDKEFELQSPPRVRTKALSDPLTMPARNPGLNESIAALYQKIITLLPGEGGRSIEFMASRAHEGASIIIREFAKSCAFVLGKSVMLLDANRQSPSQLRSFNIQPEHGLEEFLRQTVAFEKTIHQVGEGSLYIGQISVKATYGPPVFGLPQMPAFLQGLKGAFDLVLIDSPPAKVSVDGLTLCPRVDGVVLVAEAHKTRRQVAKRLVDNIEQHGGNILGVILNKRRHPIPNFIYERL